MRTPVLFIRIVYDYLPLLDAVIIVSYPLTRSITPDVSLLGAFCGLTFLQHVKLIVFLLIVAIHLLGSYVRRDWVLNIRRVPSSLELAS